VRRWPRRRPPSRAGCRLLSAAPRSYLVTDRAASGDEAALDGYMQDARREALAGQRDAAIAMTEVMRIQLV
jgi:hypothetical protein